MEDCVFQSNYPGGSLRRPRRHRLIPGHLASFPFPRAPVSSCCPSAMLSMKRPCSGFYQNTNTRTRYVGANQLFASPPLPPFLFISCARSCNSILMGFIGVAIRLSAAAQFNYIRKPCRFSPDNEQPAPPRAHRATCTCACTRSGLKERIPIPA